MQRPGPVTPPHTSLVSGTARLLVVEPNAAAAEMAMLVLSAAGFDTLHQPTHHDAIDAVEHWHPDLVLLDLLPAAHSPAELTDLLGHYAPTPTMVLSTDRDPELIDLTLTAGASAYLTKPFRAGELLEHIHTCLHHDAPRTDTDYL
ncbi:response regulator [Nocardia sp. NPDC003693]